MGTRLGVLCCALVLVSAAAIAVAGLVLIGHDMGERRYPVNPYQLGTESEQFEVVFAPPVRLGKVRLYTGANGLGEVRFDTETARGRQPLWAQRLKSQNLLAAVRRYPNFPIVLETYRQALADVFDIAALRELLRDIQARRVRVDEVETRSASPFARSLVFAYVAAYIYEQDAPLAERKAQALTLDRGLLRELLGQSELRELIDASGEHASVSKLIDQAMLMTLAAGTASNP